MTIELFTLCDGAYNYNGKLTIVGTVSTFGPTTLPTLVKMGIAMRIRVDANEVGTKDMRIRFIEPEKSYLPIDLAVKLNLEATKEPFSYVAFAAEIQGFPLEKEGVYQTEVYIENVRVGVYPFYVKRREQ